jgi:hypothetical protein
MFTPKMQAQTEATEKAQAEARTAGKSFDLCGFCMAFEEGQLDQTQTVAGFQHLIDTGLAWSLQGCYGRAAAALIKRGLCHA